MVFVMDASMFVAYSYQAEADKTAQSLLEVDAKGGNYLSSMG